MAKIALKAALNYIPNILANGFLPTRGSFMLDFVALAIVGVMVVLTVSIFSVRVGKNPSLHRKIQIVTAIVLVFALVAFEVDMRLITDWRELAKISPFYESGVVDWCLYIHLAFAIPTPLVWAGLIIWSMKKFKTGYSQGDANRTHRRWGWIAALLMFGTAVTGLAFYYLAFVA